MQNTSTISIYTKKNHLLRYTMTSTTKTTGDFDENQGILNQTVHRLDDDFNLSFHSISIIREFHINDPFCYSRNTFVLRQEILERKYTIFSRFKLGLGTSQLDVQVMQFQELTLIVRWRLIEKWNYCVQNGIVDIWVASCMDVPFNFSANKPVKRISFKRNLNQSSNFSETIEHIKYMNINVSHHDELKCILNNFLSTKRVQ